jgi:hypothetical protein
MAETSLASPVTMREVELTREVEGGIARWVS